MNFDVLSRHCDIHRHYLLEASAGTGKTYSIENIVVRLLIEYADVNEPIPLEQILVVTFTRAATQDLKQRIRGNLEQARAHLNGESLLATPDYLMAIIEKGEEEQALKRLEQALFAFDQAQIFTIHGFCSRMLRDYAFESDLGLGVKNEEDGPSLLHRLETMRDFLRTELKEGAWSTAQLEILCGNDVEKLYSKLLKAPHRENVQATSFHEDVRQFQEIMAELKARYAFEGSKILEDFQKQAPACKKIDEMKSDGPDALKRVESFAALFDKSEWGAHDLEAMIADRFFWLRLLDPDNRMKNRKACPPDTLHYPQLHPILLQAFKPLMNCSDPNALFQRLARDEQRHFKRFQEEEEMLSFDGLLSAMQRAVRNAAFVAGVRARYRVAIIDEFQDTDPVQWEIFSRLFLNVEGHRLYLVGDPKQSIYAFRQADIYTYLEAAAALGEKHHAALDTNYRSQPGLVSALNQLFSLASDWIPLPRHSSSLSYRPVQAGRKTNFPFDDSFGSIHICFVEPGSQDAEMERFFPFIAQEILRLKIPFDGWAILVKDRYQGARLAQFLKEYSIPVVLQKQELLSRSLGLPALKELIEAVLQPRQESLLKRALSGPLIGMTHEQLLALQDEQSRRQSILETFLALRQLLNQEGMTRFFPAFLDSAFHEDGKTVAERLLAREEGIELYDATLQIVEWVLNRQPSESALKSLKVLEEEGEDEERGLKRQQNRDSKGVQILTLHASKGLEFEIVFPLGLISETKPSEEDQLEYDAEKMRQLYVAMTRAKSRLYLPVVFSKNEPSAGKASPMQLFLKHVKIETPSQLCALSSDAITVAPIPQIHLSHQVQKPEPCVLTFPNVALPALPPQMLSSYTSLLQQETEGHYPAFLAPKKVTEEKNVHTLPAGSHVGNLLHTLLETVPLEAMQQARSPADVKPLLIVKGEEFAAWHDILAEIVYNAFHTPLPLLNGPTPLIATDPQRHYRETEFIFPWDKQLNLDVEHVPGFLKGVIDLLFEHEGKYYLLDWKSNRLGDKGEDYQRDRMEKAMHEGGYFMQAQVYIEALRRYLKLVDPGPFEERFGGILYVFLRGIDPASPITQGVYRLWKV